jgi:hypothetical protein
MRREEIMFVGYCYLWEPQDWKENDLEFVKHTMANETIPTNNPTKIAHWHKLSLSSQQSLQF